MTNDERIAALTSDAIRVSGDKVTKEIMATVEIAEETVAQLRADAEELVHNIRTHTEAFAARINGFVASCQAASETMRATKISDEVVAPAGEGTATAKLRELPVLINDKDLAGGTETVAHSEMSPERNITRVKSENTKAAAQ